MPALTAGLRQARNDAVDLLGNQADLFARARDLNRIGLAVDQLQTEQVFKTLERLTDRRLRQVQAHGGAADAAFPCNGEKRAERVLVKAVVEVGVELGLAHASSYRRGQRHLAGLTIR